MSESLAHASVHVHACEWYVCLAYLLASGARSLSFQSVGLPFIAFLADRSDPWYVCLGNESLYLSSYDET